jgi:(2Fe-2S) ferredoxin
MKHYERHLIACDDDDCCADGGGGKLLKAVKQQLGKDAQHVKCSKVACLGQCKNGPVLIVYPDGIWYRCDDKHAVERIVKKHLRGGKIVKDYVLMTMERD